MLDNSFTTFTAQCYALYMAHDNPEILLPIANGRLDAAYNNDASMLKLLQQLADDVLKMALNWPAEQVEASSWYDRALIDKILAAKTLAEQSDFYTGLPSIDLSTVETCDVEDHNVIDFDAFDYEAAWKDNMPCDTYGPAACSPACPQFWNCSIR